jgi:hypothetical protein
MRLNIRFTAMFFAVAVQAAAAGTYDIGEEFGKDAFWNSDPVLFVGRQAENGFEFTSDQRESAASRRDGGVSCFGIPVYESRIEFGAAGGIERVELMLYARGGTEVMKEYAGADGRRFRRLERVDKTVSRDEFFAVLKKVRDRFASKGARQPKVVREQADGARQFSQTWPVPGSPARAVLTWNFRQNGKNVATFEAGFIRLAVDGPARLKAEKKGKGLSKRKSAAGAKKIVDNVIDESKGRGDVFVDNVPMVDQGQKGYCAVATAERVLRYYGVEIDEHQIAEAAGTTADGGTSTLAMKKSVEAIAKRYRLGTVVCYGDFDKGAAERISGLNDEVRVYNKAARKLKKPAIAEDVYIRREGSTVYYNSSAFDEAADPEVLKEMKVNGAQKSKFTKFKKDVRDQVAKGIPLFWGVRLGIYPEPGIPQTAGGHMRLIIGYNDKKNEILYTDSWGAGHELKRMPVEWAWTISRCLMFLKPLNR